MLEQYDLFGNCEKMKPKMPKPDKLKKDGWTNRIAQSKEYKRREEIEVVCAECGKKFKTRSKLAKYCEDCNIEKKRERQREYARREYEKIRKQKDNG